MPNTRSAKKMVGVSARNRAQNKPVRSASKTYLKKAERLISNRDLDSAGEAVVAAISALDRAAQKGVIHPNNAARHKSRLMAKFNAARAATSGS